MTFFDPLPLLPPTSSQLRAEAFSSRNKDPNSFSNRVWKQTDTHTSFLLPPTTLHNGYTMMGDDICHTTQSAAVFAENRRLYSPIPTSSMSIPCAMPRYGHHTQAETRLHTLSGAYVLISGNYLSLYRLCLQ